MPLEIKVLSDSLPFDKIGKLYQTTYIEPYHDTGGLNWSEEYAKWFLPAFYPDKTFFYSTWEGTELVATLVGHPHNLIIDNEIEMRTLQLSLAATYEGYRKQGIQKRMLRELIEKAKSLKFDLIYAFPEKRARSLLKKQNFTCFANKDKHRIKPMGDFGINELKEKRGINPLLAKLATLFAKIAEVELQGGEIRDGMDGDIDGVLALYNSYQKRLPISMKFSKDQLTYEIKNYFNKISDVGNDFRAEWKVWERNNEILASILIRYEYVLFKKGGTRVALWWNLGYKEGLTLEEKKGFLAELLRYIQQTYPDVAISQTTMAQNELKVYDELRFPDDTANYEFWAFPLSEKGEAINRYPKYKDFFVPYYR